MATEIWGDDKLIATIPDDPVTYVNDHIEPQMIIPRHLRPEEFDDAGMFIVPKEISVEQRKGGIMLTCDMKDTDILRQFLEGGFLTVNEVRRIFDDVSVCENERKVWLETSPNHEKVDWRKLGVLKPPIKTNCRNCGAPVPRNGTCEYCGTNY